MALAISQFVKENDLTFNNTNLVSVSSGWSITEGTGEVVNTIKINAASAASISLTDLDLKADYLKLLAHVTCANTQLQTETNHNISVCYTILYEDDNGVQQTIVDGFYPKYDFEDSYESNYSIIAVPSNTIKQIDIEIYNNEEEQIEILETGIYYSVKINEQSVEKIIDDKLSGFSAGCFLRVLYSPEELDTVQEGELCICAWV